MKKYLLILCLLIFSILKTEAAIKVTPTIIEMDTKNAKSNYVTSSFNVQGGDNETIRFKIYPEYFTISPDGKMQMLGKTEAKDSLINNIKFVPSEFTLQNGRPQKVRLTITDFNKLPDGESRLVLFLEDVKPKEVILPNNYKNVSTKLLVKTRVGIPVYLDKGNITRKGDIQELNTEINENNLICTMKISSSGNSKIRYNGKAQIIKNKNLIDEFQIQKHVIGSNNFLMAQEKFPLNKIEENGEYKIRIILQYKDENQKNKNLIKESTFIIDDKTKPTI